MNSEFDICYSSFKLDRKRFLEWTLRRYYCLYPMESWIKKTELLLILGYWREKLLLRSRKTEYFTYQLLSPFLLSWRKGSKENKFGLISQLKFLIFLNKFYVFYDVSLPFGVLISICCWQNSLSFQILNARF